MAAAALILYYGLLAATAPAPILGWLLARLSNGALSVEGPRGSLWLGSADAFVLKDGTRVQRHERVSWEFILSRLWRAELLVQVHLDGPKSLNGVALLTLVPEGVRVEHAELESPASLFAHHFPALAGKLPGAFKLTAAGLVFENDEFSGEATLMWRTFADLENSADRPPGYVAHIRGAGSRIEFDVATLAGAMWINGNGAWSPDAGFSFNGAVSAAGAAKGEIPVALELLGPNMGGGIQRIRFASEGR